jgi:hypothetical protein
MASDEVVVYPWRLGAFIGPLVTGGLLIALVWGFLLTPMGTLPRVLVGVFFVLVAALYLPEAVAAMREGFGPRLPVFRVDSAGIESASGRIWWKDIDRIETRYESEGEGGRQLWYRVFLRPGRQQNLPSAAYIRNSVSHTCPRRGVDYLDVPVHGREQRDAFSRFPPQKIPLVPAPRRLTARNRHRRGPSRTL